MQPLLPRPTRLTGTLQLPADKSIAQRVLLLSALLPASEQPLRITAPGADVRSCAALMAQLQCLEVLRIDANELVVKRLGPPQNLGNPDSPVVLDCGNSGTAMRLAAGLLAGILSTRSGCIRLVGDASLSARPMERIARPLRQMGARITTTDGRAPLEISGPAPLRAMHHELPVASAQLTSAIELAALAADGRTTVHLPGPARDHTERLLAYLGVDIARTANADGTQTAHVTGPATLTNRDFEVPADISAAAFWLVAGSVHPHAHITLPNVGLNPSRTALIATLQEIGADITVTENSTPGPEPAGTIEIRSPKQLAATDIRGAQSADLIDELPILAVALCSAAGTSTVSDAAELRVKESDRIELTAAFLRAGGADISPTADGWVIHGGTARGVGEVTVKTGGDHRIAMAAAIADLTGVVGARLIVDDRECVAVSYPDFFIHLAALSTSME